MVEKILIVEDEPALQETLAYNLKHQGCKVETANDGQTAFDIALGTSVILIIIIVFLKLAINITSRQFAKKFSGK